MPALDVLREWKRGTPQIENVVLFVSDALRWDFTPDSVLSQGVAFRAVASGIRTPISFPSIVTGLYPPRLGVYSFYRQGLPSKIASLLNLPGYNTSLWTENCWTDYDPITSAPLYRILGHPKRISLEDIKPPFVYVEDEKGGHCPYGWSPIDRDYAEGDCLSFFRDFGRKGVGVLREKYQEGARRTAREFQKRMRVLDQRGIARKTLVPVGSCGVTGRTWRNRGP
jgi:arylsulfatase A-like enzyme